MIGATNREGKKARPLPPMAKPKAASDALSEAVEATIRRFMISKDDSMGFSDTVVRSEILQSLQRREQALSISPAAIARSISDDTGWRQLMPHIRHVLIGLVQEKRVIVTRGTRVLSEHQLEGGTIRIRRGPQF